MYLNWQKIAVSLFPLGFFLACESGEEPLVEPEVSPASVSWETNVFFEDRDETGIFSDAFRRPGGFGYFLFFPL